MLLDYVICMEIYVNGARIHAIKIIMVHQQMENLGLVKTIVNVIFCEAVFGAIHHVIVVPLLALAIGILSECTMVVFELYASNAHNIVDLALVLVIMKHPPVETLNHDR